MKKWQQMLAEEIKNKNLLFVSIHTLFEGFDYQTAARLKKFLKPNIFTIRLVSTG